MSWQMMQIEIENQYRREHLLSEAANARLVSLLRDQKAAQDSGAEKRGVGELRVVRPAPGRRGPLFA